jgi:hypothetical protein
MVIFKQHHGWFHLFKVILKKTHWSIIQMVCGQKIKVPCDFWILGKSLFGLFSTMSLQETSLELLSEWKKTSAMHIFDHIYEWHQRCSLCKEETTKEQCLYWFLKSLISILAKYVASNFPQSKEEAISKAQQFDLIYSQSGYLYTVLPDAPRPVPFGQDKPRMSQATNGLIGTKTHHNLYSQPPPMYGAPRYAQPYGGPYYYPPPPYQ